MGVVPSYFEREGPTLRTQSGKFTQIQPPKPLPQNMAANVSREVVNESSMGKDEIRRFSNALAVTQELINKSGFILERQRKLESELETCHERLRRFTEEHARLNESNVENISSPNSPSSLERNYESFYDHERMDAVEAIESSRIEKKRDKWNEIGDKQVACFIFEESYEAAKSLKNNFFQGMCLVLAQAPTVGAQVHEARKMKPSEFKFSLKFDDQLLTSHNPAYENTLKVLMKESAEFCDIDALVQRTATALHAYQRKGSFQAYTHDFLHKPKLKKYIEKCCKYSWKLVCQTPPYKIDGNYSLKPNAVFDPSVHQLCKDLKPSERTTADRVHFIIWPGLFDGASGRIVRKAEVLLA